MITIIKEAQRVAPRRPPSSQAVESVDPATSPLIQELLRRTEEKKEERKKERLEAYYKKNYGDYFSFQAGDASATQDPANQERIREWLQKNKEPPFPRRTQQAAQQQE